MLELLCENKCHFLTLRKGTKLPTSRWLETSKPLTLEEAESLAKQYNLGVVAGGSLAFLDVEGPLKLVGNGIQHLEALQIAFEYLPETVCWQTPSKGVGYIFRVPKGVKVPHVDRSKDYGLELRTGNHFNLIPPSIYKGETYEGRYEWIDNGAEEIAELPMWLLDWFTNDKRESVSSKSRRTEDATYLDVIENNIWSIDPDVSYPDWWKVMAVCHNAGAKGFGVFVEWSKGGRKYKGEDTYKFICGQWKALDRRKVQEKVGLTWFLDFAAPKPIELQEREEPKDDPLDVLRRKWPLMGLTGPLEAFRLRLDRFSPEQTEANYAVPLICLQAILQRKMIFDHNGLQGHWWALIGPAASGKTSYRNIIKSIVGRIDAKMLIDSFESPNGLKATFADYPSRLLVMDEGLKQFNTALANEGRNSFESKVISIILNMHNNKGDIEETQNRVKMHRIPKVIFPQLQIVTFDQKSYWETFRTNSGTMNGMVSRFALFSLVQSKEQTYDHLLTHDFDEIARKMIHLAPPVPVQFVTDSPNDICAWSPVNPNDTSDFTITAEAWDTFRSFEKDLVSWAKGPDQDEELNTSIYTRSLGFAVFLSQLLARAQNQLSVSKSDAEKACGIAALSVCNLGMALDPLQYQIVTLAQQILKESGAMPKSYLIKRLPKKYWRSKEGWRECDQIIQSHFQRVGAKIKPL